MIIHLVCAHIRIVFSVYNATIFVLDFATSFVRPLPLKPTIFRPCIKGASRKLQTNTSTMRLVFILAVLIAVIDAQSTAPCRWTDPNGQQYDLSLLQGMGNGTG